MAGAPSGISPEMYNIHLIRCLVEQKWHLERPDVCIRVRAPLGHSRHVPARVHMRTRARAREISLDLCVCVCSSYVWAVQVIISVTGGAQAFDLPSTDKELIMKGLMDGTRTLKPIFITGGSNSGIMKYVGEARAKYNPTAVQP